MTSRILRPRGEKRCNQCWKIKSRADFIGVDGRERAKNCNACRTKYGRWNKLTPAEKLASRGPRRDPAPSGRVVFVSRSLNRKLGPMPVSYSERGTCPPACMFYEAGCYAENGKDGAHWRGVGARGLAWREFLVRIAELPAGTVWRHNEAGDLAGAGDRVDPMALDELVWTNLDAGARGFTFTHKPVLDRPSDARPILNANAIARANRNGFVVNLSADSLEEADAKADLGIGPIVVTITRDAPLPARTPGGRKLVACPAQTHGMTCLDCQLCAHRDRKSIVAFRAHGQSAALVGELVRRKRAATAEAANA